MNTAWHDYFHPGTEVLRNKAGLDSEPDLERYERRITALRTGQILAGDIHIPRTYDASHLQAIHRALFQDVYDWAGTYRNVDMSKRDLLADREKYFVHHDQIDTVLDTTLSAVRRHDWSTLTPARFAADMATASTYLNTGGSALSR